MSNIGAELTTIEIENITPSKTNPRKNFEKTAMEELTASIKKHGVLQPILVREAMRNGKDVMFELVAGERRFRAAKQAGLTEIPANVRDLTDVEAIEIQVIENLQRSDLHALEEAEGYRGLLRMPGFDVSQVADRVGRSTAYVYDRIKLLDLIDPIKVIFLADKITAGHAVLLARLSAKDQEAAYEGGLFEPEGGLFDHSSTDDEGYGHGEKPRSVNELRAWIDEHVRFDHKSADPMLFPETVQTIKVAEEEAEKVIQITRDPFVQPSARNSEKIVGPRSWERADGKKGSKTCEYAVIGVVVVGYGRGESMRVCTAKEKCKAHWASFQKERAERAKASAQGPDKLSEKEQKQEEIRVKKQAKENALKERWDKSTHLITDALAEAVKKASVGASGALAGILLERYDRDSDIEAADERLPVFKTAEDLIRRMVFLELRSEIHQWQSHIEFPKRMKRVFGVDVLKVVVDDKKSESKPDGQKKKKVKK